MTLNLSAARPNSPALLLGGVATLNLPFKGGVLVPNPDPAHGGFAVAVVTDGAGQLALADTWPTGVPSGFRIYLQIWIIDPQGPEGVAASNAEAGETPY